MTTVTMQSSKYNSAWRSFAESSKGLRAGPRRREANNSRTVGTEQIIETSRHRGCPFSLLEEGLVWEDRYKRQQEDYNMPPKGRRRNDKGGYQVGQYVEVRVH